MTRLGIVALAFALVPSTAFALEVDCSNDVGTCTISNDGFDEINCDCEDMGGFGVTGGNDWSGLDGDELCQVCLDNLDFCEPFGGSTFGTTFGDTGFTATSAADTGGGGDGATGGGGGIGTTTTGGGGGVCQGVGGSSSSSSGEPPPETTTTDSTTGTSGPGPDDTTSTGFDLTTTTGGEDPTTGGPPPDTTGGPSGVSQTASATMTSAGSESDTDTDSGGEEGGEDDTGGCGCSASPEGGPVAALAMLGLFGLCRRRRTAHRL